MRIFRILLLFISIDVMSQQSVGIGTNTPNPNAALDIRSTTKGVLIPTLTTAQQNTLASLLTPGEAGMLVTDAATGKPVYWDGAAFQTFVTQHAPAATAPLQLTANNLSFNAGTAAGDLLTWDGNNWVNAQPAGQHFSIMADNRQPWLTLNYCIALQGIFPSQNGPEPYLGEIDLLGFNFAPQGWAFCNGQLLSIAENDALFILLGTTYGGDGVSTFGLPDLRGRTPLHMGSNGVSSYILGDVTGQETKTFAH